MGDRLRAGALGLLLLSGCGGAGEPSEAFTLQGLATEASPLQALAREEVTAIELARAAEARGHLSRTFRDYVGIQQWVHRELLEHLQGLEALGTPAMSDTGAAMERALAGLDEEALEDRYYAVQRPWQEAVLQRLRTEALPESYRRAALHRWGRDLAALNALSPEG